MSDLEICLSCGEHMIYWYVTNGLVVHLCHECYYDAEGSEGDNEEPCLCREDDLNPFCPSCF